LNKIVDSYDFLASDENTLYPPKIKDYLKDYGKGIREGVVSLRTAINGGGTFWFPDGDIEAIMKGANPWPTGATQPSNTSFGIDTGKFFQAGYFKLTDLIENNSSKPVFYVVDVGDTWKTATAADINALNDDDAVGLKFTLGTVNALLPGLGFANEYQSPLAQGKVAKAIYNKYY
jgi:hypothetical protein